MFKMLSYLGLKGDGIGLVLGREGPLWGSPTAPDPHDSLAVIKPPAAHFMPPRPNERAFLLPPKPDLEIPRASPKARTPFTSTNPPLHPSVKKVWEGQAPDFIFTFFITVWKQVLAILLTEQKNVGYVCYPQSLAVI